MHSTNHHPVGAGRQAIPQPEPGLLPPLPLPEPEPPPPIPHPPEPRPPEPPIPKRARYRAPARAAAERISHARQETPTRPIRL
jgi:protein TonB